MHKFLKALATGWILLLACIGITAGCSSSSNPVASDTMLSVDYDGDTYLAGFFRNTLDFDPGFGTDVRTSNGYGDAFLLKLNSSGD